MCSSRTNAEQLGDIRRQIEAAEIELIEQEAELVDLRVELSAFRLLYDTRVGRRIAEMDEIEIQIKRCRERISRYRQWGPGGMPKTRGGKEYVPVEEQYRRTWQQPPEPSPPPYVPPVDAATEDEIKALYRRLCRRFHPDLTQDPQERAWRTDMMAEVNAAYAARSLVELRALAEKKEYAPASREYRLAALREKLQHIRQRLREVRQEYHDLTHSPTMQMNLDAKLARRKGRDLLAEMATQVEKDLERKRAELDFMLVQLKQLGIDCA